MSVLDQVKLIAVIATCIFLIVKIFVFFNYGFRERRFNIFMDSFAIASEVHLHMIEDPKIREFAKTSNRINTIYYYGMAITAILFLIFKYLMGLN